MRFRSTGARERAGRPAALNGRSEPRLAPKNGREPGAPEIEPDDGNRKQHRCSTAPVILFVDALVQICHAIGSVLESQPDHDKFFRSIAAYLY